MSVKELPPEAINQIESDLDTIDFRLPIVDDYVPGIHDERNGETARETLGRVSDHQAAKDAERARVDRQWLVVTEAARRSILTDPDFRKSAVSLVSEPLDETLPLKAVEVLSAQDARVSRLAHAAGNALFTKLQLDPVPDNLLDPDINNAQTLLSRNSAAYQLKLASRYNPDGYEAVLDKLHGITADRPGITMAEKKLVASRYRYARDVKILGLMAELHDNPFDSDNDGVEGVLQRTLPSGTTMTITQEAFDAAPDLLDPAAWQLRIQLKDRVYKIQVSDQEYILKERKTPRHTDTKRHGHIDGLTSRQEFETAQEFAAMGRSKKGDVAVHWERPLGYVEFPDGYQFCVFASEPDLQTDRPSHELFRAILDAPDAYQQEYQSVLTRAKEILETRTDMIPDYMREQPKKVEKFSLTRNARRQKREAAEAPAEDELTYEEFARVKANALFEEATEMMRRKMLAAGYVNSDMDGYGFRLEKGERTTVEIIGFDFEYYEKDTMAAQTRLQRSIEQDNSGYTAETDTGIVTSARAIGKAAHLALLEPRGIKLPPVNHA